MFFTSNFIQIAHFIALAISVFILLGGIILTFKTRFVQFRMIPKMFKILFKNFYKKKTDSGDAETIEANKALFTAMSTSIGIGNIVSPIIAIKLGGPGALVGFMLAAIFGSASTFTEVTFALKYRHKNPDGTISGGPMQYLKKILSPFSAMTYAIGAFVMLLIWTSTQANTLADLLRPRGIPTYATGIFLAIAILYILIGGIKKIGDFSAKLVPTMFLLYCGATLWIIFHNLSKLPKVFNLIFSSAFTPQAIVGATVGYGVMVAFRFGLSNGFFANEAGLGTATIPHSMSETKRAINQGILSMVAVYSNGFLCLLSGLVVLLTETWLDPALQTEQGVNILAHSFSIYFPSVGIIVLMISAFLFAFGTILGNSYNGSQCYLYATKNQWLKYYYVLIAIAIFLGSISDVTALNIIKDYFYIPIAIPNIIGIVILAFKRSDLLKTD